MAIESWVFLIFGFVFVIVWFIALKNKFPTVFQPRTFLVPKPELMNPLPSGAFRWIRTIIDAPDKTIIEKCGYDAYFFLRFLQTVFLRVFFYPLTIILPVYVVGGLPAPESTLENVTNTKKYWGLLTVAIFYITYLCWVFYSESKLYSEDREQYLRTCQAGDQPTVLITGIPQDWRENKTLLEKELNDAVKDVGGKVVNTVINRNLSWLNGLAKRRLDVSRRLEERITTMIRVNTLVSPDPQYRPTHRRWIFLGRSIDTISWYWKQLDGMRRDIQFGQTHFEEFNRLDSAFVMFNTQIAAQVAASCRIDFKDRPWDTRLLLKIKMRRRVVAPHCILWDNLPIGLISRCVRTGILAFAFAAALIISATPFEYLGAIIFLNPAGNTSGSGNPLDPTGLQSRQSAFSTSVLLLILIGVVRGFVIRRGAYITWDMETDAHWCTFISLFIKGLVFPFTGDPLRPSPILAREILEMVWSPFYRDLTLIQIWFSCTGTLLQLPILLPMIIFPFTNETPRNCWVRWSNMKELAWGSVFPVYTILACVGMIHKLPYLPSPPLNEHRRPSQLQIPSR